MPLGSSMISHSQTQRPNYRRGEHGYIMLTLLLALALLIIAAAVIVPSITFEIRRDQEEEMIHRGVQYSRAIKAYYKKFNRYPMKIEDLENTNRQRFLRKRYKDPITKQDFKLLHFGEVQLALTGGIGGGTIPGASTVGPNGSLTPGSGLNDASGVGRQQRVWREFKLRFRPESADGAAARDGPVTTRLSRCLWRKFDRAGEWHEQSWGQIGDRNIWRSADRGRSEHQQERYDPRVRSQEEVRSMEVHLRSYDGLWAD